jgi:hypothetical protein
LERKAYRRALGVSYHGFVSLAMANARQLVRNRYLIYTNAPKQEMGEPFLLVLMLVLGILVVILHVVHR